MVDFLRLHLIPRQTLDLQEATLDDCVMHATKVVEGIAETLAHATSRLIRIYPKPSDGGMRFFIDGRGVEVAYGCFLGNYFDHKLTSPSVRMRNIGPSPAMKSYLLMKDPQTQNARAILATTSTLQHDHLLNYEQGYPKGWQAFIRRHGPGEEMAGKKWRARITQLKMGDAALELIGVQPIEWVSRTEDGYVIRESIPQYLN